MSDIFSNLHRLPNLKTLLCDFPDGFPNCDSIDDGTSRCLSLQMRMFEKFGECCSKSAPQEANRSRITTANPGGVGKDLDTPLPVQNKSQLQSLKLDGILPVAHSEGRGLRSTGAGLPVFFRSIQTIGIDLRVEENNETFYESDPYLDFWQIDMRNLMSMTTSSLTSLTLFNNVKTVGFDFRHGTASHSQISFVFTFLLSSSTTRIFSTNKRQASRHSSYDMHRLCRFWF